MSHLSQGVQFHRSWGSRSQAACSLHSHLVRELPDEIHLRGNGQQNVDPRGSATPLVPNRTSQNERNMDTGYNLRRPVITTATAKETAERGKRFRATTHLASAIASGDQFTAYAVEDIKASISESESQGNKYDDKMRMIISHRIER